MPEALAALDQWVGWKYGELMSNGKRKKPPINPRTGRVASPTDPATWGTLEEAKRIASSRGLEGIGFGLTEKDPFVLVDLDRCRNPETGEIAEWARKVIEFFDSYTEVSPSGTGVHIYVMGVLPGKAIKTKHVEIYDRGMYFTFTGDVLGPTRPIRACQEALEKLYARINPKASQQAPQGPRESAPVAVEDKELLVKARASRNGSRFRRLYDRGDWSGYGSRSEADSALAGALAFWTACDPERMERLFDASALGRRAKWRERPEYRRYTIELAVSRCEKVYDPTWKGPGGLGPEASEEVQEELDLLYALSLADPWTGRSGPAERWVNQAMLVLARGMGTMSEDGVVVPASSRLLGVMCGKHRQKVETLLPLLEQQGRIRRLSKGRGNRGSRFLLLRPNATNRCQEEEHGGGGVVATRRCQEETPYLLGNALSVLSDVLARVEKDTDALIIEKVAARPGMDLGGLAQALGRVRRSVQRMLVPVVEGGFVEERDGRYHPAGRLVQLVERHLEDSGSNERMEKRKADYEKERGRYAEDYEEERWRLEEGEEATEGDAEALAAVEELEAEREVGKIRSEAEVFEMARAMLPRPEEVVIPPPLPGRDSLVHRDSVKARTYRARRERKEEIASA